MRITFSRFAREEGKFDLPLAFSIAFITYGAWATYMAQAPVPMVCWFKKLIGIPCPTCGSTRALRALLELRFIDAFLWNPAVVCAAVAVAIFSTYTIASRIFKLPYPNIQMNKKEEYRLVFSLFAGLGVNWIYLIIAGV